MKNSSYNRLLEYFAARLPGFSVDLFGSLATGVTLPNSDIDILLTPFPGMQLHEEFLSDLGEELSTMGWVTSCNPILSAKIPVIKLIIDPFVTYDNPLSQFKFCSHEEQLKLPFLIKFDLTLNTAGANNTGFLSTTYMQTTFSFRPRLREALIVLKHLLEGAALNESYKGGVSSYNVFIMLICFAEEQQFDLNAPLSDLLLAFFDF